MTSGTTNEDFYKIGVSENAETRFAYGKTSVLESKLELRKKVELLAKKQSYISDFPYTVELLKYVKFKYPGEAFIYERKLLDCVSIVRYRPQIYFSGVSECFKCVEAATFDVIEEIKKQMDNAAADAKKIEPDILKYDLAAKRVRTADPIQRHIEILSEIEKIWPR
ncbi:hypothetical protein [Methylorubrum populi]|nr:hypothetical protein [Methylorubrum populi]